MPYDIAVSHGTADPFVSAYPWTPGVGFGAKYADPAVKPTGIGQGVDFCGSTDIAVSHATDPYVTVWPWTPRVGFGAKYADPDVKPTGIGYGTDFWKPPLLGSKSANMASKMMARGVV
ncbi:hypothetical protein LCGC14_2951730 [marine sediment metagenome]|uniref:Uncharacterized protein n=1 Tax=marine sediment metagenome TaxID=412755 RepID=A0A0F9A680_9ZZZZ